MPDKIREVKESSLDKTVTKSDLIDSFIKSQTGNEQQYYEELRKAKFQSLERKK